MKDVAHMNSTELEQHIQEVVAQQRRHLKSLRALHRVRVEEEAVAGWMRGEAKAAPKEEEYVRDL